MKIYKLSMVFLVLLISFNNCQPLSVSSSKSRSTQESNVTSSSGSSTSSSSSSSSGSSTSSSGSTSSSSTSSSSSSGTGSGYGLINTNQTVSGPITVSSGQTISGLKISNPDGPCITVNGSNIRITNSELGPCGKVGGNGNDVAILIAGNFSNITIDHNYIHDMRAGVYALNAKDNIVIEKNYFKNAFGGIPRGQYIQFNSVYGSGHKIKCNVGEQTPYVQADAKEDSISMYYSGGTAASPIEIAYNKIRGGSSPTGCGIMTGENGDNSYYVHVHHNNVIHPGVCGIAAAGGNHITLEYNKIYSNAGVGPGMYVWEWTDSGLPCSDIQVRNNITNWVGGNDFWNAGNCTNVTVSGNTFGSTIGDEIWNEIFAECN